MKKRIFLLSVLFMSMSVYAAEYPTEQIVRNVLDCMSEFGGLTDENMYTCSCRVDYTMSHMDFQEYENAATWDRNKQMPGDKGDTVRDSELGKTDSKKYEKVLTEGEKICPLVKHIEPVKNKGSEKP